MHGKQVLLALLQQPALTATTSCKHLTKSPLIFSFTHIDTLSALSFLLSTGPFDKALEWQQLTADQRAAVKAEYSAAGISLVVSAFGATEQPTTQGFDPVGMADTMAAFVKDTGLDGIGK
jgi:formate-dependent nitrite reductase membrane component NrfD